MLRLFDLIEELKQRKVFQVASIYLVTAWGASLGASELLPAFGAPNWVVRAVIIGLMLLFPVVVALAWFYELTRDGLVRDPKDREIEAPEAIRSATTRLTSRTMPNNGLEVSWVERGKPRTSTFTSAFTVGRDASCEVGILDPIASRIHVRFELEDKGWTLVDQSSNGTFVDGVRVMRKLLPQKCIVQLGKGGQQFELRLLDRAADTMLMSQVE